MDLTKSFFSLLALINPIGAIPFFISLTESQTDAEKRRTIMLDALSHFSDELTELILEEKEIPLDLL